MVNLQSSHLVKITHVYMSEAEMVIMQSTGYV